jgi:hypothetical protein
MLFKFVFIVLVLGIVEATKEINVEGFSANRVQNIDFINFLMTASVRKYSWDKDFCRSVGAHDFDAFPHPDSCQLFLICYGGELFEGSCPAGELFDRWDGGCFHADTVQCDDDVVAPPTHLPECPSFWIGQLPLTQKCGMFIHCNNGIRTIQSCPQSLKFDSVIRQCTDRRAAHCATPQCSF